MDDIREFEVNDWLVNEDGVCQVLGFQKYVVEPFFEKDFPSLSLEEVFENKLVCKILCDFEPKPRKSRFIKHYSSKWCEPLSGKYLVLRDKIQSEHPEQYKKFASVKIKKPILASVDFSIRVAPSKKKIILEQINDLLTTKVNAMKYENVEQLLLNSIDGIESSKLMYGSSSKNNTLISLTYDVLGAKENKFCFIGGKALSLYRSDEEACL